MNDFISKSETDYMLDIPNTCRYFTVASGRKLQRTGSIELYVKDRAAYNFIYCFVNSSFAYWWWRVFDGGITYPVGLLNSMPIPFNLLSDDDRVFFEKMTNRMISEQDSYIVTKMNAGVAQENIKFPDKYRKEINNRILELLGYSFSIDIFSRVHANTFFKE